MANILKMVAQNTIEQLIGLGWSRRRIAQELGINRRTVARYSKCTTQVHTGSEAPEEAKCTTQVHTGFLPEVCEQGGAVSGEKRPCKSQCEAYSAIIEGKIEEGLNGVRIHQDLKAEHGYLGSYSSVQRHLHRLGALIPLPFRRMEVLPGEQAQVDLGQGRWIQENGRKRKVYVFRIVLSHSRKGYSEGVYRQDTETFLRCLENAFWFFGGVPKTLNLDNLKAAVLKADWFDPELNPKMASFARHYGIAVLPIKPRTPRHNGKAESGIGYVKGNGLKGRVFEGLQALNTHLSQWEKHIADTRVHGTTKKQVRFLFESAEKKALLPLPEARFPVYQESKRKVHQDGHVEVARSYYSAPPEYLGQEVWAQWDQRLVRLYNSRMEQIAVHGKVDPGKFQTHRSHIADAKISGVERGAEYLLEKIQRLGLPVFAWAKAMMENRGIEGVRVLQGVLHLSKVHPTPALNRASSIALNQNCFRLKALRELIERDKNQERFVFAKTHPLIRDLSVYQQVLVNIKTPSERNPHASPNLELFEAPETLGSPLHPGSESAGSQFSPAHSS